jgi:hypothetical protein
LGSLLSISNLELQGTFAVEIRSAKVVLLSLIVLKDSVDVSLHCHYHQPRLEVAWPGGLEAIHCKQRDTHIDLRSDCVSSSFASLHSANTATRLAWKLRHQGQGARSFNHSRNEFSQSARLLAVGQMRALGGGLKMSWCWRELVEATTFLSFEIASMSLDGVSEAG